MFRGIVQGTARVEKVVASEAGLSRLSVRFPGCGKEFSVGESIAIAGVCLTVTQAAGKLCEFDVMGETLKRTTLGDLKEGDAVNYEPSLTLQQGLDGHIVQGHVDGVAEVSEIRKEDEWRYVKFKAERGLTRFMAEKGSVAVDGVSLTICGVGQDWFEVALIPHTLEVTTLGRLSVGGRVNVETDVIAKYVERLMAYEKAKVS
jgi:riboflavin synthase